MSSLHRNGAKQKLNSPNRVLESSPGLVLFEEIFNSNAGDKTEGHFEAIGERFL